MADAAAVRAFFADADSGNAVNSRDAFRNADDDPSLLEEKKCVLALGGRFLDGCRGEGFRLEHYKAAGKAFGALSLRFFEAPDGELTEQIRKATKVEGDKLLILDRAWTSGSVFCSAYHVCETAVVDAAAVKASSPTSNRGGPRCNSGTPSAA